jgi:hypothetical protein
MKKARPLHAGEDLGLDMYKTIYALDSTTIDLSLTLFHGPISVKPRRVSSFI